MGVGGGLRLGPLLVKPSVPLTEIVAPDELFESVQASVNGEPVFTHDVLAVM